MHVLVYNSHIYHVSVGLINEGKFLNIEEYNPFKMNKSQLLILDIVRHGQTQGNAKQIVEGIIDTPLNEKGRQQAKYAGEWLKNETYDFVFTSDLERAKETASIIMKENLHINKNDKNFIELCSLRERNFGVHEGTPFAEYKATAIKEGVDWLSFTPKDAETVNDVKIRSAEFMKTICEITTSSMDNKKLKIMVATHGFVVAQLISYIYEETKCEGVPADVMENAWTSTDRSKLLVVMPNTAITRFEIEVDSNTMKLKSAKCNLFKSIEHLPQYDPAFK